MSGGFAFLCWWRASTSGAWRIVTHAESEGAAWRAVATAGRVGEWAVLPASQSGGPRRGDTISVYVATAVAVRELV